MAVGQYGRAESQRVVDAVASAAVPSRTRRPAEGSARRAPEGGPAFINNEAEEQHYLDLIQDSKTEPDAKATARHDLARLHERAGQFGEAAEMYERNIWDGVRTTATYAGLAAAYRELGRDDLAESTLEQARRQRGTQRGAAAAGAANDFDDDAYAEPPTRNASSGLSGAQASRRSAPSATPARSAPSLRPDRAPALSRAERTASLRSRLEAAPRRADDRQGTAGVAPNRARGEGNATLAQLAGTARVAGARASQAAGEAFAWLQRSVAPFLEGQAGRRTLIATTVLLPIALGLVVFVGVVVMSARARSAEVGAVAPTPAPVATVAPTAGAALTAASPAMLTESGAATRLLVHNVGTDGLSLRQSPGVGQRVKVWAEGTVLTDLGETSELDGMGWRKVRDPEGNEGWVAADFVKAANPSANAEAGPRSTPVAPPFASGGLGLSRTEWEKVHGQPTRTSIFLEYAGGRLVIGLLESNVWHLERVWKRDDAVTLDDARNDARAYLPSDAALIQSVDRGDGRIIDVYSSEILTDRFGSTAWNGGRAGTFSIQYRFRTADDRTVTSAMFRLGDALF